MMYGILDTREHRLTYTSAGHPNLVRIARDGSSQLLPAHGFPIGLMLGQYEQYTVDLAPGDRLYIHSDGLSEAMSPSGELFGVSRMIEILKSMRDRPLSETIDYLSQQIEAWSMPMPARDDQTLVAIERTPDST
jgi:sigma-B regulation protein RsbU (phosphoserine phosphatase)